MMDEEPKRVFHIAGSYIEKQEINIYGGNNQINGEAAPRGEGCLDIAESLFSEESSTMVAFSAEEEAATPPGQPSQDDALVELLLPVFYKNADEARDFLQFARGLDGTTITQRVTDLVAKGKIDPRKAKRELYCILRGHGIYNFSESNWNKQVRI